MKRDSAKNKRIRDLRAIQYKVNQIPKRSEQEMDQTSNSRTQRSVIRKTKKCSSSEGRKADQECISEPPILIPVKILI